MSERRDGGKFMAGDTSIAIIIAVLGIVAQFAGYVWFASSQSTTLQNTVKRVDALEAEGKEWTKEQFKTDAGQDKQLAMIVTEMGGLKTSVSDIKSSVDKIADKVGAK